MSEISNKKNVREDEIDLLELLRRMGNVLNRGFNALIRAFLISVVFLLKRWLPLGLSILIGVGVSYLMKNSSSSFYTSDIVFRNNLMQLDEKTSRDISGTTAEMISKINKLHTFCAEGNFNALSAALSIHPDSVKDITYISAFWIIDLNRDGLPDFVDYKGNHNVYDTVNVRLYNSFDVRMKIKNSMDLNKIRDGIVRYIENDHNYQQRNILRLRQNHELLSRVNYDIKQLDSLQKVKYFEETRNMKPGNGGQIIFMQEMKTQLVYADIYFLYDKKKDLEKESDLYKEIIAIISDFSMPTIRENGLMFYGREIIPLFFVITLIVLIFLANLKNIQELFKKY